MGSEFQISDSNRSPDSELLKAKFPVFRILKVNFFGGFQDPDNLTRGKKSIMTVQLKKLLKKCSIPRQ